MMISLTAAEADQVRGPTSASTALNPRPLISGAAVLPVEVLDDPMHEMHHAFLAGLPQIPDPAPEDYPSSGL